MKSTLLRRAIAMLSIVCILGAVAPKKAHAQSQGEIVDQIIRDLLTATVSIGVAASGNVPAALASGFLTNYIATYGTKGIKALVNVIRGDRPADLGAINVYFIYLINAKRSVYKTLIEIKNQAKRLGDQGATERKINQFTKMILGECGEGECDNYDFSEGEFLADYMESVAKSHVEGQGVLDLAIDANEAWGTYRHLLLLLVDILIVEQRLVEAQYDVLASQVRNIYKELKKNVYISDEEKEYRMQVAMNAYLNWELQKARRLVDLKKVLKQPISDYHRETLQDIQMLDEYREKLKKQMEEYRTTNENTTSQKGKK